MGEWSAAQKSFIRSRVFELARSELIDPVSISTIQWLEEVVKLLMLEPETGADENHQTQTEAFFSGEDDCSKRIQGLLKSARSSVDICVFTITDNSISEEIVNAHQRRIRVRVISDNDKASDLGSDIEHLARSGIEVRVDRSEFHMHHKYAIFDQRRLLTGSYNWTRGAAIRNEENLIVTSSQKLVGEFRDHFDGLWKQLD